MPGRSLGVSRQGFYAWERRAPCDRALNDVWLTEKIRAVNVASRGTYGSPRIWAELREDGILVGRKRVEWLMALAGIEGGAHAPAAGHHRARPGASSPLMTSLSAASSPGGVAPASRWRPP